LKVANSSLQWMKKKVVSLGMLKVGNGGLDLPAKQYLRMVVI
jgi:hypothetical protein